MRRLLAWRFQFFEVWFWCLSRGDGITEFGQRVPFQRGFGFLPSKSALGEPFSSMWNTDLLQKDSLCKVEVRFGVMVWTFQGFCLVFLNLASGHRSFNHHGLDVTGFAQVLVSQGKPCWVSTWSSTRVWNELLGKSDYWGKNFSFTLQEDVKKLSVAGCFERHSSELMIEINCYFIFSSITDILSSRTIRLLICLTCI